MLKEALKFINYKEYEKYLNEIIQNHPKACIDIFEHLKKNNKIDKLKNLGNKALRDISKHSSEGSLISLYLSKIDIEHEEDYIVKAFMFNPNVMNLLRIISKDYFEKHKKDIEDKILSVKTEGKIENADYFYLRFFSGNFEEFAQECIKQKKLLGWTGTFQKTVVYLWIIYLNNSNKTTKSFQSILSEVFDDICYAEDEDKIADIDIWTKWKNKFKVDQKTKTML